jgi:hypothetical protein
MMRGHISSRDLGALAPALWGRVGEGGIQERLPLRSPTPDPSPQGGGERSVLAAPGVRKE